jgi:mevalonate kinase
MGRGSGYGKSILFGEHFVLYEHNGEPLPAIAAAIGSSTTCYVRRISSPGWKLTDRRPAVPGYKTKKKDEQKVSIDNILRFAGIDVSEQGIHITLGGKLVCASGVGASAASSTAIARALDDEFQLGWDDHQVNAASFEGEKGYHGTPSGIDNTAATFGGIVWFQRGVAGNPPTVETIKLKEPTELVIASSGITASTKDVVADVRRMKEEKTNWFEQILEDYKDIVETGRQGLQEMDLRLIGLLMNQNHNLLIEIGVTCDEIEEIVGVARKAGAWGAKVTGTGRGGNVIALTPGRDLQRNVAGAIEQRGYSVWTTRIGV